MPIYAGPAATSTWNWLPYLKTHFVFWSDRWKAMPRSSSCHRAFCRNPVDKRKFHQEFQSVSSRLKSPFSSTSSFLYWDCVSCNSWSWIFISLRMWNNVSIFTTLVSAVVTYDLSIRCSTVSPLGSASSRFKSRIAQKRAFSASSSSYSYCDSFSCNWWMVAIKTRNKTVLENYQKYSEHYDPAQPYEYRALCRNSVNPVPICFLVLLGRGSSSTMFLSSQLWCRL